eukprot:jgi/Botrbrau1/19106/Bobra.0077s0020.1
MAVEAQELSLSERLDALEGKGRRKPGEVSEFRGADDMPEYVQLLTRALRDADLRLIRDCMRVKYERRIHRAVSSLQPVDAGLLLVWLAAELGRAGIPPPRYLSWLRILLLHHGPYLAHAPGPGIQAALRGLEEQGREAHELRKTAGGADGPNGTAALPHGAARGAARCSARGRPGTPDGWRRSGQAAGFWPAQRGRRAPWG